MRGHIHKTLDTGHKNGLRGPGNAFLFVFCVLCLVSLCFCFSANAEELLDIRGPVSIPGEWVWLWILIAVVLICVAAIFAARFFKAKAMAVPELPRQSPWEKALESLAGLEQMKRVTTEEIKEFYYKLSVIVRTYIEERFEIRAPEMTTEEFLEKTSAASALSDEQKRFLQDFLNASDLVKFAKFQPAQSDMAEALGLARTFVQETIPAPQGDGNGI